MKAFEFTFALFDGAEHREIGRGDRFPHALADAYSALGKQGLVATICRDCREIKEENEMVRTKKATIMQAPEESIPFADDSSMFPSEVFPSVADAESTPDATTVFEGAETEVAPKAATPKPWSAIVETVIRLDVEAMYNRLSAELTLAGGGESYGEIARALELADHNSFEAAKLERAAKLEQERVDAEVEAEMEVLRTNAAGELEAEKAAGTRSKSPTIQDIKDRVVAKWPELSASLTRRSHEIHATRATCEALTSAWRSRAVTLRVLAERFVPTRTI